MKQKALKVLKQFQQKLDSFDDSTFDTVSMDIFQEVIDAGIRMAEAEIEADKEKKMFEKINQGLGLQR